MRILAVRGANLASLTGFDIDFTAEPLAGAGLFAVTGDTGAGKSTILDALCLALFGEYPRAVAARGEKIEDPSGDVHTIQDARNILRRGAASGFAEIDFLGRDGHAYRARWEARRAKGKADGRLQKELRRLDRLDGSAAIASGTRDVLLAVEDKTGLTFDQFRRTVLLAQGEFDAFLIADEKTRAELLEKITGTEIYRRISQAADAAADARATAITQLEDKAAALDLLDADARAQLEAEIGAGDARLADLRSAHAVAFATRTRAERQIEARDRCSGAEAAARAAVDAHAAASPDRDRLALIDRLAPLDDKIAAVRTAEEALQSIAAEAAEADRAADAARIAADLADHAFQTAVDADTTAAAEFANQEPLWREAEAADRDLATLAQSLDARRRTATDIATQHAHAEAALAGVWAEATAAAKTRDRLEALLQSTAGHALLLDRSADLTALLDKRAPLVAARDQAQAAERRGRGEVERLAAELKTKQTQVENLKSRHAELAADLDTKRRALRDQDTRALEARAHELARIETDLSKAADCVATWRQATATLHAATAAIEESTTRHTAAAAAHREAEATLAQLGTARREVGQLADLATAAASQPASALRASLLPGQPCPVCGGAEHPFAHGGADALVAGILARRDAIDVDLERCSAALASARGEAATAEGQRNDAERRAAEARAEAARRVATYADVVPALTAALATTNTPEPLPADIALADPNALAVMRDEIAAAREVLIDQLTRIATVRAEIDQLQSEADKVAAARDVAVQRADELSTRHVAAERARVLADSEVRQTDAALTEIALAMSPFLIAAGLATIDIDRDPAAAQKTIADLAAAFARHRTELAAIAQRLQDLAIAEAGAKSRFDGLAVQKTDATDAITVATAEHAERTAVRANLLAGCAVATVCAEAQAARQAIATARAAAETARNSAALDRVRLGTLSDSARAALAKTRADLALAQDTLRAALAAAGISDPQALEVARLPADAVAELRQRLDALERARLETGAAAAARRADLDAALVDGAETRTISELTAPVGSLDHDLDTLHQTLAAARARLTTDDTTRARAGALTAQIDAAKVEYATWAAVNDAIGSASGDKFRRFAQGITLEHLVRLANQQLDLIAPRYRLARSTAGDLALAVVDRDMGDEVRAVRSLSGGERFLVSLALALALSGLEGRDTLVDTLFIDEGFGALDAETLETAVAALETLHGQGRKVGVVTHVAAMIERIPVQIRVDKRGQGRSVVRLIDGTVQAA